jgi:fucose 4-O-acetylase-like acetyltransferase
VPQQLHRRSPAREVGRDPSWDNLRFVAGALVVLLHVAGPVHDRLDALRWLYVATWPLRVPMFAILAGYFSSAAPLTVPRCRRLAGVILLPYLAVLLLGHVQIWAMSAREWPGTVHGASLTMWFLLALLIWRLALPVLARLRHPLVVSVGVAALAGYAPFVGRDVLDLSRTLCFLPFFLLGWKLRDGGLLTSLRTRLGRPAAWTVLVVALAAAWPLRDHVDRSWLNMPGPYAEMGEPLPGPWAWAVRVAILLCGMAVALSVIRLAPRGRLPFLTYLGSGGLYIYVLHPLVLRPVHASEAVLRVDTWTDQAALVILCVLAAATLASPPVRALARPLVQPGRGTGPMTR